jgi:hypothetical protein
MYLAPKPTSNQLNPNGFAGPIQKKTAFDYKVTEPRAKRFPDSFNPN